jgi:hypothetical protein
VRRTLIPKICKQGIVFISRVDLFENFWIRQRKSVIGFDFAELIWGGVVFYLKCCIHIVNDITGRAAAARMQAELIKCKMFCWYSITVVSRPATKTVDRSFH